jgi:hypothetical protein
MANRWARNVEAELEAAIARTKLMLCVVGPRFEALQRLRQGTDHTDWVTWELQRAQQNGIPVVPVLVRRRTPSGPEIPEVLGGGTPSGLEQASFLADVHRLADRVVAVLDGRADPGDAMGPAQSSGQDSGLDDAIVQQAIDAVLRHVLPPEQQYTGNLENLVKGAVTLLPRREWLEYLTTGNLPHRPNGSAVVVLTDVALHVGELDERLRTHRRHELPLTAIRDVSLTPYRRLGIKSMANLTVRTDGPHLEIQGITEPRALRLAELLSAQQG